MIQFETCPCSGNSLAKLLHAAILIILAKEEQHGYSLIEKLSGLQIQRGERPDPAGVYRVLHSLEREGFITSETDASNPGPNRRVCAITPDGLHCLQTWIETLCEYRDSLTELITLGVDVLEGVDAVKEPLKSDQTSGPYQ